MKKSELRKLIREGIKELMEGKKKGLDGKACWDGYKLQGTKMKGGKRVDNCVKMEEANDDLQKIKDIIKKTLEKEGGASGLKPIKKHYLK